VTAPFIPPPPHFPGGPAPGRPAPDLPGPPAPSVLAVCSGKGGVGKSTVALNLAVALAGAGERVGLLDADLHAPDIPLMLGLARKAPARSWTLARAGGFDRTPLEPVEHSGVLVMSTGFIIAEDQALAWTAELVEALLRQLLWSTRWGPLDRLVIDLPPGTSDLVQAVFRLLPGAGAVVVVTPQDAAHLDTRRMLTALRTAGGRILGGIENMSGLDCPHCGTRISVFPPVARERSVWAAGVPRLAEVPMDAEGAEPVVLASPDSARGKALRAAAGAVRDADRPGATPTVTGPG